MTASREADVRVDFVPDDNAGVWVYNWVEQNA